MMSMSRCAHRERGGSARGGFDFSRTDTTSCTERSNGDQENEQRFPLRGRSLSARALSRSFLDEGTAICTHVSDQHSTYGTKVIPTTGARTANHPGGADYRARRPSGLDRLHMRREPGCPVSIARCGRVASGQCLALPVRRSLLLSGRFFRCAVRWPRTTCWGARRGRHRPGPDPDVMLADVLDQDAELVMQLADERWAWIPALLAGRIFRAA